MNEYLDIDYHFLKKLPQNCFRFIAIIGLLILIIIGIFLVNIKIYDHYQTKGYIENGLIITVIPSSLKPEEIYLNNKKLNNYEITKKIVKVDKETMNSYQEITIKCHHDFQDQEIINLTFYYHKQRIITKLKEKIF